MKEIKIKTLLLLIIYIVFFTGLTPKNEPNTTIIEKKVIKKSIPKKFISVKEKKRRFKKLLVPKIREVYKKLDTQYNEILNALKNNQQKEQIKKLKKIYKITSDKELLMALKPHPISLTLAQAALESSWGSSRFFTQANNIFGVWSFNKKEPRISTLEGRGTKKIWLKKYSTIEDSIIDYYKNIGRSFAFKEFRKEKLLSNDPLILATKLNRYSEKGSQYGNLLASIIVHNKFTQYDK